MYQMTLLLKKVICLKFNSDSRSISKSNTGHIYKTILI